MNNLPTTAITPTAPAPNLRRAARYAREPAPDLVGSGRRTQGPGQRALEQGQRAPKLRCSAMEQGRHAPMLRAAEPVRRTRRLVPSGDGPSAADATDQAGQTTAEYALLTGAIALLVAAVTAWATSTGKIGRLLDAVFNYLTRAIS